MLIHLHIRNFAIVPSLELEVRGGFTAITGETGAGKSILVDALGLLLGDRSDAGWVRAGAERAELAAEFSIDHNDQARRWLEESELSLDGQCLLRRTINTSGRSQAFINGSPVTVAQLQTLGQLLVELHGQNEHLRLTKTSEQFKLLDGSGDYAAEIESVRTAFSRWQSVARELEILDQESSIPASELEFLHFQLEELQQHDLSEHSVATLQNEYDRLSAGGALLEALTCSIELMEPEFMADAGGVNANLNSALNRLEKFVPLDPAINDACIMLREATINCTEAVRSLRAAHDRVDLNPSRLEAVAATLSQLHDLARKHRVRMDGLEELMKTLAARIDRADNSEQRRKDLQAELGTRLAGYREAARNLHQKRALHAAALSRRVIELMAELGMPGGTFELAVVMNQKVTPSPRGDDELQISISANPGMPPGPLSKIASGGELSRISLAIKVATAGGGESVTQIFDEVDAGIGGDTANAVGRLMKRLSGKRLSGNGQALCVTHLAQVAVCATHQLQVRKSSGDDSTVVETAFLEADSRVDEVARMLSGKISEKSRAHAIELLSAESQDFLGRT